MKVSCIRCHRNRPDKTYYTNTLSTNQGRTFGSNISQNWIEVGGITDAGQETNASRMSSTSSGEPGRPNRVWIVAKVRGLVVVGSARRISDWSYGMNEWMNEWMNDLFQPWTSSNSSAEANNVRHSFCNGPLRRRRQRVVRKNEQSDAIGLAAPRW